MQPGVSLTWKIKEKSFAIMSFWYFFSFFYKIEFFKNYLQCRLSSGETCNIISQIPARVTS